MVYSTSACLLPFLVALACTPGAASGTPAGDGAATMASPSPPSPGAGPSKQIAAPAPGSQPASVAQDAAEPYFGAGAARQAREHFALESWKAARDGFAAYLAAEGASIDPPTRARAELLLAIAESNLGEWTQAAAHFEAALAGLPLLADYIHYQAARARFFARDGAAAMAHARKVAADSIAGAEAELLIGDLLRGKKAHREVAAHYAAYLRERPRGMRVPEARFRLAQAYEATGKAVPDAFELYRQVTISAPLSSWATQSHKRMDALARKLGAAERKRYATLSADELIERGMVYYDAMRNPLSEADFEQALAAPGLTAASRCVAAYHRANSMFKARDRTRAAPHFDQAISACKSAGNVDLHVKAAYQAGRSYAHIGKHETAVDRYQQAESVSADHSYVDDARLRQAEEYLDMGEGDKMREVLASIPELYPQGDMRAEALWRLGWDAYQAGKLEDAIRWLEKQIEVMPIDNNYWAEGQAQYWMGRAYGKLKQPRKAVAAYRDAVIRYPLSYYSLLALNRLRESHKKDYQQLVAEIRRPPAGEDARAPAFQLKPRPEYGTPGFARALELMRLGLGDPAEAELRRLGLSVPAGKDEVTDADELEKLWAIAFLYDRAGRIGHSHWMTRWHILDYKRAWPAGHNAARWRIAYPKGYWELLSAHAAQHGFPVELIIGIVREESAFNPLLESYANAIGLTQMIFPTAERFARGTGIEVTRDNLRDPDKNVTIGSRFLGFLWNKWDGQIMLLPPSYNAGEGAVTRWLKARGTMAADEWIESIKVDQARRYSKRVISSYFTYVYLERGEIPVIPNSIPRRLLPDGADKSTASDGDKTSEGKSTKKSSKKSSSKRRAGKNKQSR